eukprot:4232641-Pyramimonas_sp.AAC.1
MHRIDVWCGPPALPPADLERHGPEDEAPPRDAGAPRHGGAEENEQERGGGREGRAHPLSEGIGARRGGVGRQGGRDGVR